MSTRIARFNIMITATANQVGAVFSKLGEQASKFGSSFALNLTSVSFAFNQISQFANSILGPIQSTANELDVLAKKAAQLQVPPKFLQAWQLAGELTGVSVEKMDKGLTIVQKRMGEFQLGLNKDIGILGLGQGDLTGDFEQDLNKIVAGINKFDTQAEKAAAATRLFGREAAAMLPLFTTDAVASAAEDLKKWNAELTTDDLAGVEAMNDAWTRMVAAMKAVRNTIVVELAPTIQQVTDLITAWVPSWSGKFRTLQIGFASLIQFMVDKLSWFVNSVDWVLQKLGVDALSGVNTFLDSFSDELENKIRELEQAGKAKVAGDAKAAVTAVAEEMAKPEYNPINAWLDRQSVRLLTWRAQQFAEGFAGVVQRALGKGKELVEAVIGGSGAGAVQAGTVEAAKFAGARVQQDQLTELKAIRKSLENLGGAGLQTGLQIITQGLL